MDAALGYTKFNVDFTTSTAPNLQGKDKFGVVPLLFALNVHVINTRRVDFWVGPQIGYVMFPDNLSYLVPWGRHVRLRAKEYLQSRGVRVWHRYRDQQIGRIQFRVPVAER